MEDYEAFIAEPAEDFVYPEIDEEEAAGDVLHLGNDRAGPRGSSIPHRSLVLHSFASALADTLGISPA